MMSEYKETMERLYYTLTGEVPDMVICPTAPMTPHCSRLRRRRW